MLVLKTVFWSRIWSKNLQKTKITIQLFFSGVIFFLYKNRTYWLMRAYCEISAHNLFSILNCLFAMNLNPVLLSILSWCLMLVLIVSFVLFLVLVSISDFHAGDFLWLLHDWGPAPRPERVRLDSLQDKRRVGRKYKVTEQTNGITNFWSRFWDFRHLIIRFLWWKVLYL